MGKECVHTAIDIPSMNRRSECGYFSPCKQGRGLARNRVQTLECMNKDILSRRQRHPGTPWRVRGCLESGLKSESLREWGGGSLWHACDRMDKGERYSLENRLPLGIFISLVLDQKHQFGALRTQGRLGGGSRCLQGAPSRYLYLTC